MSAEIPRAFAWELARPHGGPPCAATAFQACADSGGPSHLRCCRRPHHVPSAGFRGRSGRLPAGVPSSTCGCRACQNPPLLSSRRATKRVSSMQHPSFVLTTARIAAALAAACAAAPCFAAGKDCEQLRSEVVRRYEAGGIASPEVQLLPSSAATSGKVVGTCELGSKKLVYVGAKGTPSPASSPASAKSPGAGAHVLTECKDGTVSVSGSCKGK